MTQRHHFVHLKSAKPVQSFLFHSPETPISPLLLIQGMFFILKALELVSLGECSPTHLFAKINIERQLLNGYDVFVSMSMCPSYNRCPCTSHLCLTQLRVEVPHQSPACNAILLSTSNLCKAVQSPSCLPFFMFKHTFQRQDISSCQIATISPIRIVSLVFELCVYHSKWLISHNSYQSQGPLIGCKPEFVNSYLCLPTMCKQAPKLLR